MTILLPWTIEYRIFSPRKKITTSGEIDGTDYSWSEMRQAIDCLCEDKAVLTFCNAGEAVLGVNSREVPRRIRVAVPQFGADNPLVLNNPPATPATKKMMLQGHIRHAKLKRRVGRMRRNAIEKVLQAYERDDGSGFWPKYINF